MELSRHGNCGAEEENDIEQVNDDWEYGMSHKRVVEGDKYEVEERDHGKCRHEHVVVDEGGVASKGHGDDIANEGHDDEGEDELQTRSKSGSFFQRMCVFSSLPPSLAG